MTTSQLVEHSTYLGIALTLVMGGLGAPIPEEGPILASGMLAYQGIIRWWLALPLCLLAVLAADVALYWAGRHWGTRVLTWRRARRILTPDRMAWLGEAYQRHDVKIVFGARHVMGLRSAAFLAAGILGVRFWRFLLADGAAALLGIPLNFGLGYFFTDHVLEILSGVHRVERWVGLAALVAAVIGLVAWARRWTRRP